MEKSRRLRAMLRIPLVTLFAFTVFWTVWWLVTGDVPKDEMSHLSRALDAFFAALLALVITAALTGGGRSEEDQDGFLCAGPILILKKIRRTVSNFVAAACLVGIAFGLFKGMLAGLVMAVFILSLSLFLTLAIVLVTLIVGILASPSFWRDIGNWLTGG